MRADSVVILLARSPSDEARAKPFGARARAAALHRALLVRALRTASAPGWETRLVTTGDLEDARRLCQEAGAPATMVCAQSDGTLAERLRAATEAACADGHRRIVLIGADTPSLRRADLEEALARLAHDEGSAVLGPAPDGGFFLVGTTRPLPLLDGLHGPDACREAARALAALGLRLTLLAPHGDLDHRIDLDRMAAQLRAGSAADRALAQVIDELRSTLAPVLWAAPPRPATTGRTTILGARAPPLSPTL